MATLREHARMAIFIDQTFMVEMTNLEMVTNSGQQRVDVLNEGLVGFTPGSGDVTITGGFAIPIGGQEFPFQQSCVEGSIHTLQLSVGGEDYSGKGKFMDVRISQSVNANVEGSFTWTGQLSAME